MDILRKHKNRKSCQVVITPHPGEMARLCGLSIEAVQNDRVGTARDFAEEFGVTVVLKGKDTVIATVTAVYILTTQAMPEWRPGVPEMCCRELSAR